MLAARGTGEPGTLGFVVGDPLQQALQAEACPNQQFALSGYSQGAMVIATSLADMPADVADRVAAVVLFGNPFRAQGTGAFEGRTLDICASGDTVCNGDSNGNGTGHLSYGEDVDQAAEFIADQLDG